MRDLEPITMDGKYIKLNANIERYEEASEIKTFGASGVGLYRSEFLYFGRDTLPARNEQAEAYRKVTHQLHPMPVTIRTLDAGSDKMIDSVSSESENNPFMGWRSIRLCLDRRDIFTEQLKALIEAGDKGNLKIMFPMISSIEELERAKVIFNKCCEELKAEGIPIPHIEIGATIETPAAVMIIEDLAKKVDFFSIGTNDLIQFTLAVDRSNRKVASMYEPHHPAVLKSIKLVIDAAHKENIPVSICGEMAADPLSTLLLVGLGVDELSMAAWSIMECKKVIRSINYDEARAISAEALKLTDTASINKFLKEKYSQKIKSLGVI
jgi:phosphotransferase system enzyme I (PtsI)